MPNLFHPRSKLDRSTLVSPEISIEPSSSSVIVTVRGRGAVTPLIVKVARRSAALPLVGCTAVTTTLISAKRPTSKKSAERRCLSRRPMPVLSDAARMSRRPKTAPLPVSCPSPLNSVKRPLTFSRPHMFLTLKVMAERSGTMFHTPALSGSLSSVSRVVIVTSSRRAAARRCLIARLLLGPLHGPHRRRAVCYCSAPPRAASRPASSPSCVLLLGSSSGRFTARIVAELIDQRRDLGGVEVLVDPVDQAVCAHPDHDADPHGDRLPGMAGGVQDVLLDEATDRSVIKELPVENLVVTLRCRGDEPVDDPHRPGLVVVAAGAHPPHRNVVAPQSIDCCPIAVLDRREEAVGHGDDGLRGGGGHGWLLF